VFLAHDPAPRLPYCLLIVLLLGHIPFKFNSVIERVAGQASKFMAQTVDLKAAWPVEPQHVLRGQGNNLAKNM